MNYVFTNRIAYLALRNLIARVLCLSILVSAIAGCTANQPWRTQGLVSCPGKGCDTTIIQKYENYDLSFVEFTERGNVFNRDRLNAVLEHVDSLAQKPQGVAAIVFVHGWKHNASEDDENVRSFRKLLAKTAALRDMGVLLHGRKLVGIYIGWRGLSLDVPLLKELSYWERKAVAHEVGKGGVTEFLLRLERTLVEEPGPQPAVIDPNKNLFLVIGHSFGGAIVLTALNEILIERLVSAQRARSGCGLAAKPGCRICLETRNFGHGVVLLNPAIEANEALQLKELSSQICFAPSQQRLLHVISSDADEATNKAFRIGQWFGVSLSWREAQIERNLGNETVQLDESDLDTITVGNFIPFQTGQLRAAKHQRDPSQKDKTVWHYDSCVQSTECLSPNSDYKRQHIPVSPYEPLAFIHTDSEFIADHNDVFNDNVAAYLAAIMAEARHRRAQDLKPSPQRLEPNPQECMKQSFFDFGSCFSHYQKIFGLTSTP